MSPHSARGYLNKSGQMKGEVDDSGEIESVVESRSNFVKYRFFRLTTVSVARSKYQCKASDGLRMRRN